MTKNKRYERGGEKMGVGVMVELKVEDIANSIKRLMKDRKIVEGLT
jgi:hypothetical protein